MLIALKESSTLALSVLYTFLLKKRNWVNMLDEWLSKRDVAAYGRAYSDLSQLWD